MCNGNHSIDTCTKFVELDTPERWNKARKHKLCYGCLGRGHIRRMCKVSKKCSENCNESHHSLLHSKVSPKGFLATNAHLNQSIISLRMIPIIAYNNGKQIELNALLDDGSSQTFLDTKISNEINLVARNGRTISVKEEIGGNTANIPTSDVEFEISGLSGSKKFKITAITTRNVVGDTEIIKWDYHKKFYPHLKNIEFGQTKSSKIDLLIGIDHPDLHLSIKEKRGNVGEPIARLSLQFRVVMRWQNAYKCQSSNLF